MRIGFIGLGMMGSVIARRLAAAGHDVLGWNLTSVEVDGVTLVSSPNQAFQAELVFTMVSDDDAVRQIVLERNLLASANRDIVHIGCSTISAGFARELTAAHRSAGIGYISATVLGSPTVAAKGQLNVLTGGAADLVAKAKPALEVFGKKIWDMGEEPVAANAAKIASNMMVMMAMEAMGEAVALTESYGLPRDKFFDLITGTMFNAPAYVLYAADIETQTYEPGLKAVLGLKDLRLAREAASDNLEDLPMLDTVHKEMGRAVDSGLGSRSWSIVADYVIKHARDTDLKERRR